MPRAIDAEKRLGIETSDIDDLHNAPARAGAQPTTCARSVRKSTIYAGTMTTMNERLNNRMDRALDWIECHLGEAIVLADVADKAHLSAYHFARLFRVVYGDSVMNYVRGRRLSKAAQRLTSQHDSVLSIAVDCGFGSNEAFTRAFRRQYGISPSTFRRNADRLRLPLQRRLTMSDVTTDQPLVPTFSHRAGFFAVGYAGEFQPGATNDIGALWQRFGPRMDDIPNRIGRATYGICCLPEVGPRMPERFTYVAAVEVEGLDDIPDGMIGVEIPPREYAVFAYDGGIGPNLPKAVQYIFGEWLPNSEFDQDGADFEYYDEAFDPDTNAGTFYIYLPIKRR